MTTIHNGSSLLIELHYLPCIHFFSALRTCDALLIEANETFQKQSYRNRTRILTAQKVENLLIPVLSGNSHLPIRDVRIDHSQKWRSVHQRAIQTAYGKSPFFEYYSDDFFKLYETPVPFLFDFNLELLTVCLKSLGWKKKISFTSDFQQNSIDTTPEIKDFRGLIHPKKPLVGELLPYQQVFGRQFEPNLSIMDLLFCEGNNSNPYLIG